MGAPRQHIRREVRIALSEKGNGTGRAKSIPKSLGSDVDLRALCGTSHAEAHVPVRGSVKRVPCGLNGRLPDAHVTAATF